VNFLRSRALRLKVRREGGLGLESAAGARYGNLTGAMSSVPSWQEWLDAKSHCL
jgi:hypothetical protein